MFRRLRRDQRGVALNTVLIVGAVLATVTGASVAYAVSSLDLSRHDQDWNAALAAAESGIDDYLYRLNREGDYWTNGNTDIDNPAFTGWTSVPGGSTGATYRYSVDTSQTTVDGSIKLTSTGKVGTSVRTVSATLRRRAFIDYLYFTDYETSDPILYGANQTWAQTNCVKHWYEYLPVGTGRPGGCSDINFISQDTIRGPLHTNDAFLSAGSPRFEGETTTSYEGHPSVNSGKLWRRNSCCSGNPIFTKPGYPRVASPLEMPATNASLKLETTPPAGTGCYFRGPTRIVLNSNGTMTVTSPFTAASQGNCPLPNPSVATTMALPENGVVYVDAAPASAGTCTGSTNRLGYPKTNDITYYGCYDGDVFISGTLSGRLTVAAANRIVVVGNTVYNTGTSGTDMLGLIADNSVEIYHPVRCTNTNNGSCVAWTDLPISGSSTYFKDATVHAAILTLNHSFTVQNYNRGDHDRLDDLHVVGAIAQKFRGPVGTFSGGSPQTGYAKDYLYDQRLRYSSPPRFLDPVKSAYQVATWVENPTPVTLRPTPAP